ncbi:restriction endonuclease subunit S, partial [Nostoc sp. NIES-2111]
MREVVVQTEEFKDSPVGGIPKDWEVFRLSEVVPRAEYGISVSLDDEIGIPVLRMNNLKDGEIELTDLKKSASSKAANLLLKPLDVLFNRTNSIEHVGRTSIWRGQIEQTSFASYLVRLIPDQSKLIPNYLNIWLNLPSTQLLIRRYATPGVHQVNINPTNLRKVLIALPTNLLEQKNIAEILDTVDEAIARTSSLIIKLKQTKAGLLQDLLTLGLDEDGKLRDPQVHPEQFKDSPLGQIPRDWEVLLVSNCVERIEQGWSPDCEQFSTPIGEWGVLKTTSVVWEGYQDSANKRLPSHLEPDHNYEVKLGDVLMTRAGPNYRVGVVALVNQTQGKLMLSDKLYRLVPREFIKPNFLVYALSGSRTQSYLSTLKTGLAESQTNISQDIVRSLLVILPSEIEQESIISILNTHEKRIRTEETYLNKL